MLRDIACHLVGSPHGFLAAKGRCPTFCAPSLGNISWRHLSLTERGTVDSLNERDWGFPAVVLSRRHLLRLKSSSLIDHASFCLPTLTQCLFFKETALVTVMERHACLEYEGQPRGWQRAGQLSIESMVIRIDVTQSLASTTRRPVSKPALSL